MGALAQCRQCALLSKSRLARSIFRRPASGEVGDIRLIGPINPRSA